VSYFLHLINNHTKNTSKEEEKEERNLIKLNEMIS